MISNYWEELSVANLNANLSEVHNHLLEEMDLPGWLRDIECPFCHLPQPLSSIREFGIKLNPRNLCDIFVQVACYQCQKMDTLYYKRQVADIGEFMELVSNRAPWLTKKPITEEEMYQAKYNNMIEMALERMGKRPVLNTASFSEKKEG